jgi:hypothetical protein
MPEEFYLIFNTPHRWKHAECDHAKKGRKEAAKQNPSSI